MPKNDIRRDRHGTPIIKRSMIKDGAKNAKIYQNILQGKASTHKLTYIDKQSNGK